MTTRELAARLAALPDGPVKVLDNHTGDVLQITFVDTPAALDVDVVDDDSAVVIMVEE